MSIFWKIVLVLFVAAGAVVAFFVGRFGFLGGV